MKCVQLLSVTLVLTLTVVASADEGQLWGRRADASVLQPLPAVSEADYQEPIAAPAPMVYQDFPSYPMGYSSYRGLGYQGYCCESTSPYAYNLWAGYCAGDCAGGCAAGPECYDSGLFHGGLLASCLAHLRCGRTECAEPCGKGGPTQKTCATQKSFAPQKSYVSQKTFVHQKTWAPPVSYASPKVWAPRQSCATQKGAVSQKGDDCCSPPVGHGCWPFAPRWGLGAGGCGLMHGLKARGIEECCPPYGSKGKGWSKGDTDYEYNGDASVDEPSDPDAPPVLPPPPSVEDRPTDFSPLPSPSNGDRSARLLDWLRISPTAQNY